MIGILAFVGWCILGSSRVAYLEKLVAANWDEIPDETKFKILKNRSYHMWAAVVVVGFVIVDGIMLLSSGAATGVQQ